MHQNSRIRLRYNLILSRSWHFASTRNISLCRRNITDVYLKTVIANADSMYRRRSSILQGQVSNPSERGTRGRAPKAPREVRSPPQKVFVSHIKMVSFYASTVIFIDAVTANRYERKPSHLSCKKSTIVLLYVLCLLL